MYHEIEESPERLQVSTPSNVTEAPEDQNGACHRILKDVFGYDSFRAGQQEVITQALNGRDSLILLPTGGGKSLCYQVPALVMDGLTIVVSPLISLMKDQVQQLLTQGVQAAFLNSSQARHQQDTILEKAQQGLIKLIYVAPERLCQRWFINQLQQLKVKFIAIDEAHCVSQWGHDFRPEYTQLGQLKQAFLNVPFMALTATADTATQSDIAQQLQLDEPFVYRGGFDRPNIKYDVLPKYKGFEQVLTFVKQQKDRAGIIYCGSRKKVDDLNQKLQQAGIKSDAYHAGLDANVRDRVQTQFLNDDLQVVVATVAFGMGINKSNVRFVVHHDVPRSVESYYQETGRAGRDNLPAQALLLYDERDAARIKQWIETDTPEIRLDLEMQKFKAMEAFAESQTCRRLVLLNYFSDYRQNACGNCDICLDPPQMFDGTKKAQQVLSCVLRLKLDTPVQLVIDILRGLSNKRVLEHGYDKLSTYGIGKAHSDSHWFSIIQQMIHLGLMRLDMTQSGMLRINESARSVLKGERAIQFAVPKVTVQSSKPSKLDPVNIDKRLFAKLKHLRKQISEDDQVPAFIIFSDATLADMADKLPTDNASFLSVSGVGQNKLEKYGPAFIRLIEDYLDSKA